MEGFIGNMICATVGVVFGFFVSALFSANGD